MAVSVRVCRIVYPACIERQFEHVGICDPNIHVSKHFPQEQNAVLMQFLVEDLLRIHNIRVADGRITDMSAGILIEDKFIVSYNARIRLCEARRGVFVFGAIILQHLIINAVFELVEGFFAVFIAHTILQANILVFKLPVCNSGTGKPLRKDPSAGK